MPSRVRTSLPPSIQNLTHLFDCICPTTPIPPFVLASGVCPLLLIHTPSFPALQKSVSSWLPPPGIPPQNLWASTHCRSRVNAKAASSRKPSLISPGEANVYFFSISRLVTLSLKYWVCASLTQSTARATKPCSCKNKSPRVLPKLTVSRSDGFAPRERLVPSLLSTLPVPYSCPR